MVAPTPNLPFEAEVLELERKAAELERLGEGDVDFSREVKRLRQKARSLLSKGLAKLDAWQTLQLARHPSRPAPRELLDLLLEERADVGGAEASRPSTHALGLLAGRAVVGLACEVGAEGWGTTLDFLRGVERAVSLAERLERPLVTLIDVAEVEVAKGGQMEVAMVLGRLGMALAATKVPTVAVVTGEATSPLAQVLMIADEVLMMRYAALGAFGLERVRAELYEAATALAKVAGPQILSAEKAQEGGFVDGLVEEPEGGAQRAGQRAGEQLKGAVEEVLGRVSALSFAERLARRAARARGSQGYKER